MWKSSNQVRKRACSLLIPTLEFVSEIPSQPTETKNSFASFRGDFLKIERSCHQELPVPPGCFIVRVAEAEANNNSVTQTNDVKPNPATKISSLSGTQMSAHCTLRFKPGTLQLPWLPLPSVGMCLATNGPHGFSAIINYILGFCLVNGDFCKQPVGAQAGGASDSHCKGQTSFGLTQPPSTASKCTHTLSWFSLLA